MAQIIIPISVKRIDEIMDIDIRYTEPASHGQGVLPIGGASALNESLVETWDKIKEAVRTAAHDGWEAAKTLVEKINEHVRNTAKILGTQAQLYRDRLVEKIQESLTANYDMMIGSLKQQISVGTTSLPLKSIEVEFKTVFTGSVELSLTSLCKMVASGEMTIKGSYGLS